MGKIWAARSWGTQARMDLPLDLLGGDVLTLAGRKDPLSKPRKTLGCPGELLSWVAERT